MYSQKYEFLFDLNISILKLLLEEFDIKTKIKLASEYNLKFKKSDRALDLALKTKSTHLLFGELGENYADINKFTTNNIKVLFQKYKYPKYNHLIQNNFLTN